MHTVFRNLGNLLVLTALVVGTSYLLRFSHLSDEPPATDLPPAAASPPPTDIPTQVAATPIPQLAAVAVHPPPSLISAPGAATSTPEAPLPITRLVIASIGLDTNVVAAPLVDSNGVRTWQVPAFKAGHAEDTGGAGQAGNAVLMGHVSSLHSGDVFKNLDRVQVGDEVEIFSGERRFIYRVYDTRSVPRTDLTMAEPTSEPIISLFTCTGTWDPVAWDFTERLFVRARLVAF